jgi:hypothetical protein
MASVSSAQWRFCTLELYDLGASFSAGTEKPNMSPHMYIPCKTTTPKKVNSSF